MTEANGAYETFGVPTVLEVVTLGSVFGFFRIGVKLVGVDICGDGIEEADGVLGVERA